MYIYAYIHIYIHISQDLCVIILSFVAPLIFILIKNFTLHFSVNNEGLIIKVIFILRLDNSKRNFE